MSGCTRAQAIASHLPEWAEGRSDLTADQVLLLDRVYVDLKTDCWLWLGCIKPNGYGRLTVNRRQVHAHRFALQALVGLEIPPGMDVCHTCDTRSCINPAHLFIGTRTDNMRDAKAKGRLSTGAVHGEKVRQGRRKARHGRG